MTDYIPEGCISVRCRLRELPKGHGLSCADVGGAHMLSNIVA